MLTLKSYLASTTSDLFLAGKVVARFDGPNHRTNAAAAKVLVLTGSPLAEAVLTILGNDDEAGPNTFAVTA